jgi:hypothetical protein
MYWYASTCPESPFVKSRLPWLSAGAAAPAPEPAEEFRPELVARVRHEITAGVYETPDKWEAALDRLLDRLEQV